MKALVFERHLARFAASRLASSLVGSGHGVALGPLELLEIEPPELPGPGWVRLEPRLAGICGSDVATLDGRSSSYFEHVVSFPFVPGHEVVADVRGGEHDGARVVVEAVLSCSSRGMEPLCSSCVAGETGRCENLSFGAVSAGLQIGYCADTGGGWSSSLVAHESQLHFVGEDLSDEDAVMIEPTACAVHAVCANAAATNEGRVVVLGAGTLGLLTVAALRAFAQPRTLLVVAKHPEQRRLATELGADQVVEPSELVRAARRMTGSLGVRSKDGTLSRIAGGVDTIFDCVGSAGSIESALSVTRPGGNIVLVGMPGPLRLDLAPLWQREVTLRGAYAYGTEQTPDGPKRTFELASDLVGALQLGRFVSACYPLERFEEAVAHAAAAGRRGGVKIVFDMRRRPAPAPRSTTEKETR